MALEETDRIDLFAGPHNGKLELVIVDAGITSEATERLGKLIKKLQTYVGFILSDEFKQKYPSIEPASTKIKVIYCNAKPTKEMEAIVKISPRGDFKKAIAVSHEYVGSSIGSGLGERKQATS